jgi:hypothetical protein
MSKLRSIYVESSDSIGLSCNTVQQAINHPLRATLSAQ